MSRDIGEVVSNHNKTVHTTVFNGGQFCGTCLQLSQNKGDGFQNVQLTRDQVVQQIIVMTNWLGK